MLNTVQQFNNVNSCFESDKEYKHMEIVYDVSMPIGYADYFNKPSN